jgi:hypothetical protein
MKVSQQELCMRVVFLFILLAGLVFAAGCGGSPSISSSSTPTGSPGNTNNVVAISVNGGPEVNQPGGSTNHNAAFATATVCVPGDTSKCVTIDGLLVDTGATGLRVFDSTLASLNLPAVNASNGSPAYNCLSYEDGSFLWGPVKQADVTLGGETASKLPIQVISSTSSGVPSGCTNGSTQNEYTAVELGAKGILGVGFEPTDCFLDGTSLCDPSSGQSSPPSPAYYTCSGGTCSPAFIAKANQITNPVVLFPKDNNGVILELPSASSPAATLNGSLIFGIGTESNNQLPSSATVFTLACDAFTTIFNGQTFGFTDPTNCVGPSSAVDSGSNAIYFPNVTKIPQCPSSTSAGDLSGLYCPTATQNLSATIKGQDGKSKSISFSVANAQELYTGAPTDAVLPSVAGANPAGSGFIWGLPFFYGKNVYSSIDGQSVPTGAPPAPWWAF